jgi:hypothetical protein
MLNRYSDDSWCFVNILLLLKEGISHSTKYTNDLLILCQYVTSCKVILNIYSDDLLTLCVSVLCCLMKVILKQICYQVNALNIDSMWAGHKYTSSGIDDRGNYFCKQTTAIFVLVEIAKTHGNWKNKESKGEIKLSRDLGKVPDLNLIASSFRRISWKMVHKPDFLPGKKKRRICKLFNKTIKSVQ